jgi:SAM-dependent methyltransferase
MSLERLVPGTAGWDRYSADHVQRYEFFARICAGKKVLDMACGTGYGSHLIANSGASSVTGVDISEEAVAFALKNYNLPNLAFRKMDYRDVPALNQQFEIVISFETIEHVQNPAHFISVAAEVLAPDGQLVVSTPSKQKYAGAGKVNPFHLSELYYEEFREIFQKHVKLDRAYHQTETAAYLRMRALQEEIETLKYKYDTLPFGRLKRFVKTLIGRKEPESTSGNVHYPRAEDFALEPMPVFKEHYSVIILEGTKR